MPRYYTYLPTYCFSCGGLDPDTPAEDYVATESCLAPSHAAPSRGVRLPPHLSCVVDIALTCWYRSTLLLIGARSVYERL